MEEQAAALISKIRKKVSLRWTIVTIVLTPMNFLASLKLEKRKRKSKQGKLKNILWNILRRSKARHIYASRQHSQRSPQGCDIVRGYVETHSRKETDDLVNGFEVIPPLVYQYKTTSVTEMDLADILPENHCLYWLTNFAHTMAPGSRHVKGIRMSWKFLITA